MQEVVDNYTKANIPLDVMWGDIDYMERWRDFTFDPVNFPLPALQVRPRACASGHSVLGSMPAEHEHATQSHCQPRPVQQCGACRLLSLQTCFED